MAQLRRAHRRQRGSLVLALGSLAAGVVVTAIASGAFVVLHRDVEPGPPSNPSSEARAARPPATTRPTGAAWSRVEEHWLDVLDGLDARRAVAWRRGRADLLASVYTQDSAAMRVDRVNLHEYARRGLRVIGARIRYSSATVERRTPDTVTLLVVDRLAPVSVIARNGRRQLLPRDLATCHQIELRLVDHRWRIATISLARDLP